MTPCVRLLAVPVLCFALAACSQPTADPRAGTVRFKAAAVSRLSGAGVCADFTLTPYSLDAAGAATPAGAAIAIPSGAPGTAAIVGCVDTLPAGKSDWRYLVTATHFTDCATHLALPGAAPAVATFTKDFDCARGVDTAVEVLAEVSVPVANSGGYVDISATVDAQPVLVGCKQADLDAAGVLHFGQSALQPAGSTAPLAFTGIGVPLGVAAAPGSVRQFEGQTSVSGQVDSYFTGLLDLHGQDAALVQTLVGAACPAAQMTVALHAPLCETLVKGGAVTTTVSLADVLQSIPGVGTLAASIAGPSAVQVWWSGAGPHLSSAAPASPGFDTLASDQRVDLAPLTILGLFPGLLHAAELQVLVQSAAGLQVVTLAAGVGGGWAASAPAALPGTLAAQQALGIFAGAGCLPVPPVAGLQPPPLDLGTLPGGTYSEARAINDAGQVVGRSEVAADNLNTKTHAFSWTLAGGMVDLGTLGGDQSSAVGVNASGQVIGLAQDADYNFAAFLWTQAGGMVSLGRLGGTYSEPEALNDAGQVVGYADTPSGDSHAFSWTQGGGIIDLGTLGGPGSEAKAVNAVGQVVGNAQTAAGAVHAFSWTQAGGMIDLGTLGPGDSRAISINSSGLVVGYYWDDAGQRRPFAWTQGGGMLDLGSLVPGGPAQAYFVNDAGQVSGYGTGLSGFSEPFLWTQAGGMLSLGRLDGASGFGNPYAINASAEVVGRASVGTENHAFAWTAAHGMVDLGAASGPLYSTARAVNTSGEVVGEAGLPSGEIHAVLWTTVP